MKTIIIIVTLLLSPNVMVKANDSSALLPITKEILTRIKNNEFAKLSEFFHPITGVRFSPYAYVDTIKDIKLTKGDFIKSTKNDTKYRWGTYDGRGNPIIFTVKEYFSNFIYDVDFLNADTVSINNAIGSGNTINNIERVYIECEFTESHFFGFKESHDGMDWCSLRLVFKKYENRYYLVGITHANWTI